MGNEDKKESEDVVKADPNLDKYNIALQHLATDIGVAINKYLKQGYVNLAALIGVLEDQKINVSEVVRRRKPIDRVKFQEFKGDSSYIG